MKPVQYFSDEYLAQCRQMTPDQVIRFLDEFRQLRGAAQLEGTRYQTQIKRLMADRVRQNS